MIVRQDRFGQLQYAGAFRGAPQQSLGFVELIVGAAGSLISAITGAYSTGQDTERLKIESARQVAAAQAAAAQAAAAEREKSRRVVTYVVVGGAVVVAGALILAGSRRRA